jgi:hypothetical protein
MWLDIEPKLPHSSRVRFDQTRVTNMQETSPPLPESPEQAPSAPSMSLGARLLNVFACPGDVFEEVKASRPSAGNWLVPGLMLSIVGVVFALIVFSQPAIVQTLKEQQEKKMDQLVKDGKMSRSDADRAIEQIDRYTGPTVLKLIGSVGSFLFTFGRMLWWGLILMLLGRWFLNARFSYGKSLEVAGLALMISTLGVIVSMLLIVKFERLSASPGLGMAIADFDVSRKSHLFAGAANIFSIWQVCVLAVGLSRLAGARFTKALLVIFVYWILQESVLIECGMGQMAQ